MTTDSSSTDSRPVRYTAGIVACFVAACAARSTSPTVAPGAPTIEFAIVEPAPDLPVRPGILDYEGETFTVRELRRFRFATAAPSQDEFGWPAVSIVVDPRDSREFEAWTGNNVGRTLAVVVDGYVITKGDVYGRLPAMVTISSPEDWTEEEARSVAARIHAGGTAASHPPRGQFELAAPYEPIKDSPVEIVLERGSCFGKCPTYTLRVRGDGSVWFDGRKHVRTAGPHDATVGQSSLRKLLARFAAVDFFSLPDRSEAKDADSQSIVLTLTVNGRSKRVEHLYGGGDWGDDPAAVVCESLDALADAVDYETGSMRWIGQ